MVPSTAMKNIDVPSMVGGLAVGAVVGYFLNQWMQARPVPTQTSGTPPPPPTLPAGQVSDQMNQIAQRCWDYLQTGGWDCAVWNAGLRGSATRPNVIQAVETAYSQTYGFFRPSLNMNDLLAAITRICAAQQGATYVPPAQPPAQTPAEQFREPTDVDIERFLAPWGGCDKWTHVTPSVKRHAVESWQGPNFGSLFLARVNAFCARRAVQEIQRRQMGAPARGSNVLMARPMPPRAYAIGTPPSR
jgi:hypothetical protein